MILLVRRRSLVFVPRSMPSSFRPDQTYSRLRLWWPAIALMGTLVVSSHFSGKPAAPDIVGFDKIAHFCVFGLLGTLIFRTIRRELGDWRRWGLALLGVAAYAVTDEFLQYFNPDRSFDVLDWAADGAGALLAVSLYRGWAWYRDLLEFKLRLRLAK